MVPVKSIEQEVSCQLNRGYPVTRCSRADELSVRVKHPMSEMQSSGQKSLYSMKNMVLAEVFAI